MRVGIGYDSHRLVNNRPLILGGMTVPYYKGLLGHSDADVLCHAIIDAIVGALSQGDIGMHFPPSAPEYEGAYSIELLKKIAKLMADNRWKVVNVDATVICEAPSLKEHIPTMKQNLAQALGVDLKTVNVKATTNEGMGFVGRGEGMAAMAVCLLGEV